MPLFLMQVFLSTEYLGIGVLAGKKSLVTLFTSTCVLVNSKMVCANSCQLHEPSEVRCVIPVNSCFNKLGNIWAISKVAVGETNSSPTTFKLGCSAPNLRISCT